MSTNAERKKDEAAFRALFKKLGANEAWIELKNWRKNYPNARAGVLVLHAIIDHALETAIATHFVTPDHILIFGGNRDGLLSTTYAKISLGYHLGIFPAWIRDDLKILNDIRNAFAHSPLNLSFNSKPIQAKCSQLISAKVQSYRHPQLELIAGQMSQREWNDSFRSYFRDTPVPPPPEKLAEYQRMQEIAAAGPPHSEDDRNRLWVICSILFSYFSPEFSEGVPLKYTTSGFYAGAISCAAPQ